MKIKFTLILFLFTILNIHTYAGDTSPFKREVFAIHPKFGYNLNFYLGNFSRFSPIIDCGINKDGFGTGIAPSLAVEIPLSESSHFSLGLGFSDRSGAFLRNDTDSARDLVNPPYNVYGVNFEQKIDVTLEYIELQADFRTVLFDKLITGPLRAFAGVRAGYANKSYANQTETILSPTEAVYVIDTSFSKTRTIAKGNIDGIVKYSYGATIGLENMLNIGNGNYLTQAVSFDYFFNSAVEGITWNYFGVRFDLGLRYNFRESKETAPPLLPPRPVIPLPDYTEPPPKALEPVLDIKIHNPQFRLLTGNELLSTLPLVNAVFFENSSSVLPGKYATDTLGMPEFFTGDAVGAHLWVLPRIASIVKGNSNASIVVEGATSGRFEKGGLQLAMKRANEIKKAFIKLGVNPGKISVRANYKPRLESNEAFEAGSVENQRADIFVKNAPLQEYVALQKFAEISGKYNVKASHQYTNPDSGSVTLRTELPKSSLIVKEPTVDKVIALEKYRVNPEMRELILKSDIEYASLSKSGNLAVQLATLPREVIDLDLSKFLAVIRFDYNSSDLSEDNKGLLKQMAEFLPAGATIIISGSADALGAEERNKALEKERADNTRNYIKLVSGSKFNFEWVTDSGKFAEETPEGRFLNRNIKVKVKK